jgi:chromosome partitioning protein
VIVTVTNYKGGSSKTTTAVLIAHAFHEAGLSVLLVDADPQGSALRWSETGGFPMPVIGMPVKTLHTQLPGIAGNRDVVVIDTPPVEDARGIVTSALRISSHVLVPVAPTPIEVERLAAMREAIGDVADLRADAGPAVRVLMTRTVSGAASTAAWRAAMTDDGWTVLGAAVPRLERFAQAYGDPIARAAETAYGVAVSELLDAEVPA